MKAREIREIKETELKSKLEELRKELMKYNSQISTGTPPENPGRVKMIKKTIARINLIMKKQKGGEDKRHA